MVDEPTMKWAIIRTSVELPDDWRPYVQLSADDQLDVQQFYNSCRLPPMTTRDKWLAPVLEAYMNSNSTATAAVKCTNDPYEGKRETINIPYKQGVTDRGIRPDR